LRVPLAASVSALSLVVGKQTDYVVADVTVFGTYPVFVLTLVRLVVLAAKQTVAVRISTFDSFLKGLPLSVVEDSTVDVVYRGRDSQKLESLSAARC
jgi:hypothetical protein